MLSGLITMEGNLDSLLNKAQSLGMQWSYMIEEVISMYAAL